jgi:hypothetical protein
MLLEKEKDIVLLHRPKRKMRQKHSYSLYLTKKKNKYGLKKIL